MRLTYAYLFSYHKKAMRIDYSILKMMKGAIVLLGSSFKSFKIS